MQGRWVAGAIALLAVAGLVLQAVVLIGPGAGLGAVLWDMSAYFTILTNLLVALGLGRIALGGPLGAVPAAGLALWIGTVGVIYHLLLSGLRDLSGLAVVADQILHTAVPVLVPLWWILFARKEGLRQGHAALWLVWPLAYCAYALVRAQVTGVYPYPFIDAAALGPGRTALNIAGLTAAFWLAGLGLVALGRRQT